MAKRSTDTVPAMLTPGEFVVRKKSAQAYKPLLKAINKSNGGPITGGIVRPPFAHLRRGYVRLNSLPTQTPEKIRI